MAETHWPGRVLSRLRTRFPQALVSDERLVSLVRRGDGAAFEALYDRHVAALLSYCFFLLGSREDAEDAVQTTFASAYGALLRDERHVEARPWLFAIARNTCIGMLRKRRPQEGEELARPAGEDLLAKVERRESVRQLLVGLQALPERHRTALLLAELHGHSQREIGRLLGVSPETVKSYIFQARTTLASERAARETACHEIREELAGARGAALLRGRLRRHLRSCAGCREYADQVSRRRRALGALLPLLPTIALRRRVLDSTAGQAAGTGLCAGGAGAGATLSGAIELGGAGAKTLVAKLLIGAGLVAGAGAGGIALVAVSPAPAARVPAAIHPAGSGRTQRLPAGAGAPSRIAPAAGPPAGAVPPAGPTATGGASRDRSPAKGASVLASSAGAAAAGKGFGGQGVAEHGGQAGAAGEHGKAKGHGEAHGNSAAAHAGAHGKGSSAEHAHVHGKGAAPGHDANGHGAAGRSGEANRGKAHAQGQGGNAPGHAQPASPGQVNGNPHPSVAPPPGGEGPGAGAHGQAHPAADPTEETPAGPPSKETGAAASEPAGHGQAAGATHEPPGQAKR